jgi:hypothetical protein
MRRLMLLPLMFALVMVFPGSAVASFGFKSFDVTYSNQDGSPDTQAGSHPFAMTTSFALNTIINFEGETAPNEDVKDVKVDLPPGLVGSATAVPQCSLELLTTAHLSGGFNTAGCSDASAVGTVKLTLVHLGHIYVPIYSLVPPPDVPAAFGFDIQGVPVVLLPSVRTGGDYGLEIESANTSQALGVLASTVTIWGVPADPIHDPVRGQCLNYETGGSTGEKCPAKVAPKPLLTLPSACSGPLTTTIEATSWQGGFAEAKSVSHDAQGNPVGIDGCNRLDFSPSLSLRLDTSAVNAPAGLETDLRLPQNENPAGVAEADVHSVTVALPQGMVISPSGANGLGACSEARVGLHSTGPGRCPDASKVGSVMVETPLLEHPLEGSVYVARQYANPFGSLLALYVVAEGSGVSVKLAGRILLDEHTGQLTAVFEERQGLVIPQLPFSDFKLTFFGGPRAALVTPRTCGAYQASARLTPWSSVTGVSILSEPSFQIALGCASRFTPTLSAGATSAQAGVFAPFTTTISRSDEDQYLHQVSVVGPVGFSGVIASVPECPEPQASQGACPASSKIGHVAVLAGPGPDPVVLPEPGRQEDPVYLTGPYEGAPFGLSILTHAEAGPFDLGPVIVRAAVSVDPHTAQVIVKSDPLPRILQGIPLQLRSVNVTIDRAGFTFNPTNCEPLAVTGTATSTEGASAPLSTHFQVANCANLKFKPEFEVSTSGKTSKANGASLNVKLSYPNAPFGSQANIASVKVELPKQLPSRLTTLQKACTAQQFASNPAGCPSASVVGHAVVHTPILPVALEGPAYFVSNGGEAFPNLIIVLQGDGVTVDLVGSTFINKHGITSSAFKSTPDVPFSTFELNIPEGRFSALAANANLCATMKAKTVRKRVTVRRKGHTKHLLRRTRELVPTLSMPTTIVAQNGARIEQSTKISVEGCATRKARHRTKAKHRRKGR